MIIFIGGQKGGSGKSTIAVNIAAYLAKEGADVMIVDADRQASITDWEIERKAEQTDKPKLFCVQKYNDIDDTLEDLDTRYQYVIVDCAGRDAPELRSALLVSDILLIPLRPSQMDLNTLPGLSKIIKEARRINKKLIVKAILSMGPTNPRGKEIEESRDFLSEYPDITLLNTIISDRKVYRDSISMGLGVVEFHSESDQKGKAKIEIEALMKELLDD